MTLAAVQEIWKTQEFRQRWTCFSGEVSALQAACAVIVCSISSTSAAELAALSWTGGDCVGEQGPVSVFGSAVREQDNDAATLEAHL